MRRAGLILAAVAVAVATISCGRQPPLNVLLITLDTTRADHLGCYGYDAIETPNIDRLAAEGTLYERCYTPVPITLPSHLSILTGTYPVFHGVRENAGFYVADELDTLAEILNREGYATAAFVGAFPLDSQTGLDQGFELYDDNYPSSLEEGQHPSLRGAFDERPAAEVVQPAIAWIDQRGAAPFFLWTHFFDPHQPQIPPSPYRERYADALYDGEIASVDEAIGRLLTRIAERGFLDRTLVVVTADHGEGLGDHGELTHALLLHSSTVRVPLIVRDPRGPAGERVSRSGRHRRHPADDSRSPGSGDAGGGSRGCVAALVSGRHAASQDLQRDPLWRLAPGVEPTRALDGRGLDADRRPASEALQPG